MGYWPNNPSWAVETLPKLTPAELKVLEALHAGFKVPTQKGIAAELGLHQTRAGLILNQLEAKGIILSDMESQPLATASGQLRKQKSYRINPVIIK